MRKLLSLVLTFTAASAAQAEEWTVHGARQMGMGGAGVASTRGARAMYWNPAALARASLPGSRGTHSLDVAGGVSASLAAPDDTLHDLDALYHDVVTLDIADLSSRFASGTPPTQSQLQAALRIVGTDLPALEDGGALADAAAGPALRFERFGVALTGIFHGGVDENLDLARVAMGTNGIGAIVGAGQDRSGALSPSGQALADQMAAGGNITQNQAEELVFQAEAAGVNTADPSAQAGLQSVVNATAANVGGSNANSITNNQSGSTIRDIFVQELAVGYGQPIGDWLAIGVAPKAMHAFTYTETFVLQNLPSSTDLLQNIVKIDNDESSYQFGIDAGVLFTPLEMFSVGVTGRNLNRPRFDIAGGGKLALDPNVRAGVAFSPLSWISVAADLDLFHNKSDVLPGYKSQVIGGGVEFLLGAFAIRGGLSKNLLDANEDVLLHAGIGLDLRYFHMEGAVMMTPSMRPVDSIGGTELPQRAGGSLTLGFTIPF